MGIIISEEKIESQLKGNTLRVYWFLLSKSDGLVGARETQHALKFSSPALAVYHLDKLVELGLVESTSNGYHLLKTVNVGVLKQFIRFRTIIIPRHLFYAAMFTTLFAFFLTQFRQITFYSTFALAICLIAMTIMWYETFRAWQLKP